MFNLVAQCLIFRQRLQVVVLEAVEPNERESADEHYLNVIRDVRDESGHRLDLIFLITNLWHIPL